ncbi:MAG: Uma2 family endonuclease [Saprospiraceae bacterium]|jgi:Uma2 family endonuclease|nr:Uma2 family endonuclease [Saprospiraceae bacterium]MBK9565958.1 Uma2 family endonuclease [Saprospiraceae bacterium]
MINDINQLDLNKTYSYADYLLWRFEERVELIKGKILKMSPAPSRKHQGISSTIHILLGNYLMQKGCVLYAAPFDVRLPISEDLNISKKYKNKAKKLQDGKILTVVQPDITVVCDPDKLDERGCIGAPDLVIEILSPGNKDIELKDKFEIYQESGIKEYWIVEPDEYIIVYTLQKGKYNGSKPFTSGEKVTSTLMPELALNVSEIFR